jgi:hypothetical protein
MRFENLLFCFSLVHLRMWTRVQNFECSKNSCKEEETHGDKIFYYFCDVQQKICNSVLGSRLYWLRKREMFIMKPNYYGIGRGTRLNTCTRCPLRTYSSLESL